MCAFLAATIAAITDLLPVPCPFAAPFEGASTDNADFRLMSILHA